MAVGNQTIDVLQETYGAAGFQEPGHCSVWQGPVGGPPPSPGVQGLEGLPRHSRVPMTGIQYETQSGLTGGFQKAIPQNPRPARRAYEQRRGHGESHRHLKTRQRLAQKG